MFCHKCGSKLAEDALFCSQCGSKVSDIIKTVDSTEQKVETITCKNTSTSEESLSIRRKNLTRSEEHIPDEDRVITLLNKHFKEIVRSEKQLLIMPSDIRAINAFPKEYIENFTMSEPLLVFNYMNDGMKDGFVITDSEFSYIYGQYGNTFNLNEILYAECGKAGLAPTMTLYFNDKTYSKGIYLTSINDYRKFVSCFNSFIKELNQPELYMEEQSKINSKDLKTILSAAFDGYCGDTTYCNIGTPLSTRHSKFNTAIKNFNIDSSSEIYMIYDESILGNCKKGFLVTYQGIYYKQKDTVGYISWEEFKDLKLSAGFVFSIGKHEFATLKKDCNIAFTTLSNLQKMLRD